MVVGGDGVNDWTLTWNGMTVGGSSNPYELVSITGLHEAPEVLTSDQNRARQHGQWAGTDLLGGRTIQAQIDIHGVHPSSVWQSFSQAVVPGQPSESVLEFQIPGVAGGTTARVGARVRRIALPIERNYSLGLSNASVEWHCTDPRIYSSTETTLSTTQATSSGGLVMPAAAPLVFGGTASGGQIVATNGGEFPAPWTATIAGPVTTPRIENITTGQTITFNGTVADGQTLVISSLNRTVLLNGTASRYSWLTAGSSWFDLPAGSSTVRFAGASGSGSMTFVFRSVWI